MKALIPALGLLLLGACSSNGTMEGVPVNYQVSDLVVDGQVVKIGGRTTVKVKRGIIQDEHPTGPIEIFFDDQKQISGVLDKELHGEFFGWGFRGHSTSAKCDGDDTKDDNLDLRCVVSIDGTPRVTLLFQVN